MIKLSLFQSESEAGPTVIPLFGPSDSVFEKTAAPTLLPDVARYIETLKPKNDSQYVLVNAMGAFEYFGSNVNGDAFTEASLIHAPDDWTGNPLIDAIKAKTWPYGYPTFYEAHPYAHHRNKDSKKAFGNVELACWHPRMKRVELVTRVDRDKCLQFGGSGTWDKLKAGEFPDVSMGTKVPFDTCSICLDWKLYREAQATFDKNKHKHPGDAALDFHKELIKKNGKGIRGLSITRKDYCEHAAKLMNRILPDGRKVFVFNDFPKFFDISFVFIGADKTAKTMMKIADAGRVYFFMGSAELAEKIGYSEDGEKTAADIGKTAKKKEGEIVKNIVPSQFANKAVPVLTKKEPHLPKEVLNLLGGMKKDKALATTAGLGIVLRPREFQRIILIQGGNSDLADKLDSSGIIFPQSDKEEEVNFDSEAFSPSLAKLLLPFLAMRSGLGPFVEKRIVVMSGESNEKEREYSSLSSDLLHKIGAAYNGYRSAFMNLLPETQNMVESVGSNDLSKLACASAEEVFTPLSYNYFKTAFLDEVGIDKVGALGDVLVALASVERGIPSRNTQTSNVISGG